MVCDRCIQAVTQSFDSLKIPFLEIRMGEVLLPESLSEKQQISLNQALNSLGFEIIRSDIEQLCNAVKTEVIRVIQENRLGEMKHNWSTHLSQVLHKDYHEISTKFSEYEKCSIEHYIIAQKIEKAKELLLLRTYTGEQIASMLGYSSGAYFSTQFKQQTGFTPKNYMNQADNALLRIPLDQIR